jgi:hypothetical protein
MSPLKQRILSTPPTSSTFYGATGHASERAVFLRQPERVLGRRTASVNRRPLRVATRRSSTRPTSGGKLARGLRSTIVRYRPSRPTAPSPRARCTSAARSVLFAEIDEQDVAALGLDPSRVVYRAIAGIDGVDEKATRDAGSVAVADLL